MVESICQALCEKATTQGVTERSIVATSAAIHAACSASCAAVIVHDSPVKAIQWMSGVSNEYQKFEPELLLTPAFSRMAAKRRENCANAPPPCVP